MTAMRAALRNPRTHLGVLAVVLVGGLVWAKWLPAATQILDLSRTHIWTSTAQLTSSADPTFASAVRFAAGYFDSVWPAAVIALLVAAGLEALVPAPWLPSLFNRRSGFGQAVVAGTTSLPSMMCTCCTAPLVAGIRRRGGALTASLAYWLGNPVLNPAVLVFLFLALPWQLGVVRLLVGVFLVFGVTPLIGRLRVPQQPPPDPPAPADGAAAHPARRYLRALVRFAAVFVPEYVVTVLLIGAISGWLPAFGRFEATLGILAVVLVAIAGTLLVIPTGGEIPVLLALTAAGAGSGTVGALLIALPAVSAPSMVMLGRALSWRVTVLTAGAAATAGLLAGALLWVLK